jgi:hypothetical protein
MPTLELQAAMCTACCAYKNEERDRDTQRLKNSSTYEVTAKVAQNRRR